MNHNSGSAARTMMGGAGRAVPGVPEQPAKREGGRDEGIEL